MSILPARWRWPYLGLLAVVAALLSVSALQAYRLRGGTRLWEPVLWESTSVAVVGALALVLHSLGGRLRGQPWWRQVAAHAVALPLFSLVHIGGMFGLRLLVYAVVGVDYQPDALTALLVYEGGKDAVAYISFGLISRGIWIAQDAAAREAELDRTRRALAETQLARLADQLQPHFLFNSLNLISSVMYDDVARADRLLCQLADLLRQTLSASEKVEHTVDEELALVRPFLALMQERFGPDRLQVEIEADRGCRACKVPALVLLTPVENAVKHHVACHLGLVQVTVCASLRGQMLHIAVSNLGEGPLLRPQSDAESGLGLRNLRQRLEARYGSQARLTVDLCENGATLELEIPCGS
ncbi:MAG: histidine kinase [Rubrivivax sp.]|nr:histidine kinase [Rubrivivax sp.]